MKKLLEFLVVVLMILSMVSCTLGIMLFQKRELLKGRTQKLEQALMKLARTIESGGPKDVVTPAFPARDIDETTARLILNPSCSDFWDHYAYQFELEGRRTMNLSGSIVQLASYYRIDPVTLKPMRDPVTGERLTDGPGTMQALLDGVIVKSSEQLHRLNDTRHELKRCRHELVGTISELNVKKQGLRTALHTVVKRDRHIAKLDADIVKRDQTILERNEEILELNETVADKEDVIRRQADDMLQQKDKIARLEVDLKIARGEKPPLPPESAWRAMSHGHKGKVQVVNTEWNFALLELTDHFVSEYLDTLKRTENPPPLDLLVMRDAEGQRSFVTKVQLSRIDRQKGVAVANLLPGWEQGQIQAGDLVLY